MQIIALQMDIAWEEPGANLATIEAMVESAVPPSGSLILTPELVDIGFSMNAGAARPAEYLAAASRLARRWKSWLCFGMVLDHELAIAHDAPCAVGTPHPANTMVVVRPDGTTAGAYRKLQPFGLGEETGTYSAGDKTLLVDCNGLCVSPLICYDLRFPELWRLAARAGAQVMLIGASWPAKRAAHWRALTIARAIENQAIVVACNRVGRDPNHPYLGGSIAIGPDGAVLAELGDAPGVMRVEATAAQVEDYRRALPFLRDAEPARLGSIRVVRKA